MTTRAALRNLVRLELHDNGVPQLWTDDLLNAWISEAIRDYSAHLSKPSTGSIAAVADQADYALPADCLRVARVEHPSGFRRVPGGPAVGDVLDPWAPVDGASAPAAAQPSYDVWGSYGALTLTLDPAPADAGDPIVVRYLAAWAEPAADGSSLATPPIDDHLLKWSVCAAALRWLGTDEAKRQRWEQRRGASAVEAGGAYADSLRAAYEQRERRSGARRLAVRE
jgi:hypothetical protein